MTGQDAVNVAKSFDDALGITGVILTKLDGDARGGAALSIRAVTDKPIKYVGMGEKMDELEEFHPDRLVSKILGMGDVLTLIEKAQSNIDQKKAMELEKKLREETFTLDDFLDQIAQMRNLGPIENILQMIPGMNSKALKGINVSDKDIAIIRSMTMKERMTPNIINASRKKRIALGSGTTTNDVNKLLKQFEDTKKMMKRFGSMEKSMKRKGKFNFPFNI